MQGGLTLGFAMHLVPNDSFLKQAEEENQDGTG